MTFRARCYPTGFALAFPLSTLLMCLTSTLYADESALQRGAGGYVRAELIADRTDRKIRMNITIADGWHINAHVPLDDFLIPTALTINDVAMPESGYPKPALKTLRFNEISLALYEGSFSLVSAIPHSVPNTVKLTFQACSDTICLPPEDM